MKQRNLSVGLGSLNPVKIKGVTDALNEIKDIIGECTLHPVGASSNVSEQPMTLEDTIRGAKNRALGAHHRHDVSIGVESGLMEFSGAKTGYMDTTVCAIFNGEEWAFGQSPGFEHPQKVINYVESHEVDLDTAFLETGLITEQRAGYQRGLIHHLSDGRVSRQDLVAFAVRMALMQATKEDWFGFFLRDS